MVRVKSGGIYFGNLSGAGENARACVLKLYGNVHISSVVEKTILEASGDR